RCFKHQIRVESEIALLARGRSQVFVQLVSVPQFGADGRVSGCKTTITDISALKRAQEKLEFLAQASAALAASFDYHATMAAVAGLAVPVIADVCIVDLDDRDGELRRLKVAFADPAKAEKLAVFGALQPRGAEGTAIGHVMRTRAPLLFPDLTPEA